MLQDIFAYLGLIHLLLGRLLGLILVPRATIVPQAHQAQLVAQQVFSPFMLEPFLKNSVRHVSQASNAHLDSYNLHLAQLELTVQLALKSPQIAQSLDIIQTTLNQI